MTLQSTPLPFSCPIYSTSEATGYANFQSTENPLIIYTCFIIPIQGEKGLTQHTWLTSWSVHCSNPPGHLHKTQAEHVNSTQKSLHFQLAPNLSPLPLSLPGWAGHPVPDTRHHRPLSFNMWCLQVAERQESRVSVSLLPEWLMVSQYEQWALMFLTTTHQLKMLTENSHLWRLWSCSIFVF